MPRESEAIWMTPAHQDRIRRFVVEGGGLAVIRSGLASYPKEGPWGETVRGRFLFHPEEHRQFALRPTGADRSEYLSVVTQGIRWIARY